MNPYFALQTMTDIASLIQTLGFPVALSVLLLIFSYKVWKSQEATIKLERDDQREFAKEILISQKRINETMQSFKDLLEENSCKYQNERGN